MSGGSQTTKSKQSNLLDPNIYSALYGAGATQPQFNTKGQIKPGTGSTGTGGLMGAAAEQFAQGPQQYYPGSTYASLNPLQTTALNQQVGFLNSPEALSGYTAANQVGRQLMGGYGGQPTTINGTTYQRLEDIPEAEFNALQARRYDEMVKGGNPLIPGSTQSMRDIAAAANQTFGTQPTQIAAPTVNAAQAQAGQPDYRGALSDILQGGVNPYVNQMAQDSANLATQNFLRQIAPQLRGGAQMAGQFGGSRQGVMEGLAVGDLNRDILAATNQLYGGAFENAQNRRSQAAQGLAGLASNESLANAQMQMQGNILNAQLQMQQQLAQQDAAFRAAGLGLNYDLANRGMGLDYDIANRGLGLQDRQLTGNQAIAGAGLIQNASQIPLQNLQGIFNVGQTLQGDTQGQINADVDRWNFNQQAPWQNLQNYAGLLYPQVNTGSTQIGKTTQSSTLGAGQILGGLGSMALGAMAPGGALAGMFAGGGGFNPALVAQQTAGALGGYNAGFQLPQMNIQRPLYGFA